MLKRTEIENHPLTSLDGIKRLQYLDIVEKVEWIKLGITAIEVQAFRRIILESDVNLAKMLSISSRMLHMTKRQPHTFSEQITDKAFGLAEVYSLGFVFLGDPTAVKNWINSPKAFLFDKTPMDIISTWPGKTLIISHIKRIVKQDRKLLVEQWNNAQPKHFCYACGRQMK